VTAATNGVEFSPRRSRSDHRLAAIFCAEFLQATVYLATALPARHQAFGVLGAEYDVVAFLAEAILGEPLAFTKR
jgi:hypothetical protein